MRIIERLLGTTEPVLVRAAKMVLVPALLAIAGAVAIAHYTDDLATKRLLDNVHWTLADAAAAALAWIGVRAGRGESDTGSRRWFAWALSCYLVGQLLWDLQVWAGYNPFPGPSDVLFVALGLLSGFGFVECLYRGATQEKRRMAALDVAGLTAAVLALTLALYLPRAGEQARLQMAFLVGYPVMLCWAACVGMVTVLALRLRPHRGWILMLLALVLNGVLWLDWNSRTLDHALKDGVLDNALFSVASLMQGTGALLFRAEPVKLGKWERFCEGVLRLSPLLTVVLSSAAVVLVFALPNVPPVVQSSALLGALVVLVLATVRQSLLLRERERLIQIEQQLRKSEERYRVLVEQAADGIFVADSGGTYLDVNPQGAAMLGMTREEIIGLHMKDIVSVGLREDVPSEIATLKTGKTVRSSWTLRRGDGTEFPAEVTARVLPDGNFQGFVRDVSERQALEVQLRQAQKMDAIGTLAAGIAHDFNNILSAIRGNADLAALDLAPTHSALESITQIQVASGRAAELVQRIVAFSRPRVPKVEVVDLSSMVAEVTRLLRSALPAGAEIAVQVEDALVVAVDPAQIHQVLMNLCTNAWQAFDGRPGRIEIDVSRLVITANQALHLGPGEYACIKVSDDGQGMNSKTRDRIFEPFFTTKEPGVGTGLGLSVVHSIVRGHKGAIFVDSVEGSGTTFSVYLPCAAATSPELPSPRFRHSLACRASARIACVDDEPALVSMLERQLGSLGFDVVGFSSSEAALAAIRLDPSRFDLVMTDFNMPRMSGLDLAKSVLNIRADMLFVLTSGYIDSKLLAAAEKLGIVHSLQKPATLEDVQRTLEAALANKRLALSHPASA